jgi:hypothetical protein
VSKKLCHLNIREIAIRDVKHVPGHSNIADLLTKEFKSDSVFRQLAFMILSVRDPGGCYVESGISPCSLVPAAAAA